MAQQTILIIDDDADILNIITVVLKEAGYAVRTGRDVSDLYEIEKNAPDLILLDNWLDGKTGHDICYHLKTTPKTSTIPVLLFSASPNLAQTAASCKADGYIAKPFEVEDLLAVVQKFSILK
jgi:DNA-binding response OmpR family regulator